MKKKSEERINLLSPREEEITIYVEMNENKWWFSEETIYTSCVNAVANINLSKLKEHDVNGPIHTFLINWGMMARILGRREYNGWERRLTKAIKETHNKLENFRKLKLENCGDISSFKNNIEICYGKIKNVIGITATSKVLHLICPNFFPMWDTDIRKKINECCKNLREEKINESELGYYNFVIKIQKFLIKYEKVLSNLSKKYNNKSKVRIIDEFMWGASR